MEAHLTKNGERNQDLPGTTPALLDAAPFLFQYVVFRARSNSIAHDVDSLVQIWSVLVDCLVGSMYQWSCDLYTSLI
jgi:hypothetical protein